MLTFILGDWKFIEKEKEGSFIVYKKVGKDWRERGFFREFASALVFVLEQNFLENSNLPFFQDTNITNRMSFRQYWNDQFDEASRQLYLRR